MKLENIAHPEAARNVLTYNEPVQVELPLERGKLRLIEVSAERIKKVSNIHVDRINATRTNNDTYFGIISFTNLSLARIEKARP